MSSNSPLYYIKTKHSLRKKEKLHVIKKSILDKIQNDIDVSKLRVAGHIDNSLILFICSCIEELLNKKKYDIDKKQFAVEILNAIFNNNLSGQEVLQVESQIDFAHENDLIQKVEFKHKAKMIVFDWVKRKFL